MTTTPPPVLLLWGEDPFLLREAALDALEGLSHSEVEAEAWQGGETGDLATPSLFGERRALLVTGARTLPEHALREIGAYVSNPSPDARLVLLARVGERAKAPAGLSKLVSGAGGRVQEVAIPRKELPRWVAARAERKGLSMRPDALAALVETVGESPAVLDQSLGQLAGAFGSNPITRADVESQFRGLGEQRVWDLCDRMFERDLAGAIRSLRTLLEAREEALPILGGIASRLRDLLKVRSLPDRMPPADVARAAGLRFDWQARRYREQARRFTPGDLIRIHQQVVEADRVLKSGGTGDVVLPVLVAAVAGPATRP